mmetsp:Transcript_13500/g.33899  ORF Transcript_13500/g.33899 Transcript_13500/m.33899 type:complete len:1311 (+) Transcript_13500:34-3966(+)
MARVQRATTTSNALANTLKVESADFLTSGSPVRSPARPASSSLTFQRSPVMGERRLTSGNMPSRSGGGGNCLFKRRGAVAIKKREQKEILFRLRIWFKHWVDAHHVDMGVRKVGQNSGLHLLALQFCEGWKRKSFFFAWCGVTAEGAAERAARHASKSDAKIVTDRMRLLLVRVLDRWSVECDITWLQLVFVEWRRVREEEAAAVMFEAANQAALRAAAARERALHKASVTQCLHRVIAQREGGLVRSTFCGWREILRQTRGVRRCLQRLATNHDSSRLRMSVSGWHTVIVETKRAAEAKRRVGHRGAVRRALGLAAAGNEEALQHALLVQWQIVVHNTRVEKMQESLERGKAGVRGAIAKFSMGQSRGMLQMAFADWKQGVQEAAFERELEKKNRDSAWHESVRDSEFQMRLDEAARRQQDQVKSSVARCLQRFAGTQDSTLISMAFHAWVREARHGAFEVAMSTATTGLRSRALACLTAVATGQQRSLEHVAVRAWAGVARAARSQSSVLKCMQRMANGYSQTLLLTVVGGWREVINDYRSARVAHTRVVQQKDATFKYLEKMVAGEQRVLLGLSYGGWATCTANGRRQRLAKRIATRMADSNTGSFLRASFQGWLDALRRMWFERRLAETKAHEQNLRKETAKVHLEKMASNSDSALGHAVFMGWRELSRNAASELLKAQVDRHNAANKKLLTRFLDGRSAMALRTACVGWRELVHGAGNRKHVQAAVDRFAKQHGGHSVQTCFKDWVSFTRDASVERMNEEAAIRSEAQKERTMKYLERIASASATALQESVILAWTQAAHGARQKNRVAWCVQRFSAGHNREALAGALVGWRDVAREEAIRRKDEEERSKRQANTMRCLEKVASGHTHALLQATWHGWLKAYKAASSRSNALSCLEKVAAGHDNGLKKTVVQAWYQVVAKGRGRETTFKCLEKMAAGSAAALRKAVMNAWIARYKKSLQKGSVLRSLEKVASGSATALVHTTYTAWTVIARHGRGRKLQKACFDRLVSGRDDQLKRQLWADWRDAMREAQFRKTSKRLERRLKAAASEHQDAYLNSVLKAMDRNDDQRSRVVLRACCSAWRSRRRRLAAARCLQRLASARVFALLRALSAAWQDFAKDGRFRRLEQQQRAREMHIGALEARLSAVCEDLKAQKNEVQWHQGEISFLRERLADQDHIATEALRREAEHSREYHRERSRDPPEERPETPKPPHLPEGSRTTYIVHPPRSVNARARSPVPLVSAVRVVATSARSPSPPPPGPGQQLIIGGGSLNVNAALQHNPSVTSLATPGTRTRAMSPPPQMWRKG